MNKIEDINFVKQLGYRIKLLGICYLEKNKLKLVVEPFLISKEKELSNVNNNLNAIIIDANNDNKNIFIGMSQSIDYNIIHITITLKIIFSFDDINFFVI